MDDHDAPVLLLRADKLGAARRVLVARQVDLSAAPGDVVAVEGVNGSGKSTLLAATARSGRSAIPRCPLCCERRLTPVWPFVPVWWWAKRVNTRTRFLDSLSTSLR